MPRISDKHGLAVRHKLKLSKTGSRQMEQTLTQTSVLKPFADSLNQKSPPKTPIQRATYLQKAYQSQYIRAMRHRPEYRRDFTFDLNCPPSGFRVNPRTRTCQNPRVCPWCHVRRRVMPTYEALTSVPQEVRYRSQVAAWYRDTPYDFNQSPFSRSDRGPHQWVEALLTVQMIVPVWSIEREAWQLRHVGMQIVPEGSHFEELLYHRLKTADHPASQIWFRLAASVQNCCELINRVLPASWRQLYLPKNLPTFLDLQSLPGRHRWFRVNRYKPQGDD